MAGRIHLSPGYHAEPGETSGHLHDVYTTIPPLGGNKRVHVGTLSKAAVEAWASSSIEMATALLFALEHDDDKDVADFLRDWMSGDTSRWFEFTPKYRAMLAEKARLLAARPEALSAGDQDQPPASSGKPEASPSSGPIPHGKRDGGGA